MFGCVPTQPIGCATGFFWTVARLDDRSKGRLEFKRTCSSREGYPAATPNKPRTCFAKICAASGDNINQFHRNVIMTLPLFSLWVSVSTTAAIQRRGCPVVAAHGARPRLLSVISSIRSPAGFLPAGRKSEGSIVLGRPLSFRDRLVTNLKYLGGGLAVADHSRKRSDHTNQFLCILQTE